MPSSLSFARQRVLILAPHPDDESLATGGLLQRALKQGAQVRVLFISDGDNNPWAQRFVERRWRIGPPERARWAARRREEAFAALRCLGLPEDAARCLGLPDQGTTLSLLHAAEKPLAALIEAFTAWRPTLVVGPSLHDVHPDHNALAVLVGLALTRYTAGPAPKVIHYLVHTRKTHLPTPRWTLHLSAHEREVKREAILCHRSQMALSRKRFVAYARSVEHFYPATAVDPSHPIRRAVLEDGALCVRVQPSRIPAEHGELLVAFESAHQGSIRWRVPVRPGTGTVRIHDAITGRLLRNATIRTVNRVIELRVPLAPVSPVQRIAVKFNRRLTFYDEAGWREVALPAIDSLCSATSPSATPFSSPSFASSSFGGVSEALA